LIENLRVWIEVLQDARGDRIEFDGHALYFGPDLRRHHAEEMADARSGFEHSKRVESADPQIIESFVNRANNRKRGVVSVERARCDLPALFNRQDPIKLRMDRRLRKSAIRKKPVENFAVAPAGITCECTLFIRRQIAVCAAFRLQ